MTMFVTHRPTPMAAFTALGLAVLCGLLASCAVAPSPQSAAPVAVAPAALAPAAMPLSAPAPAPSEYVKADDYLSGAQSTEKIPSALEAESEALRAAAIAAILSDQWSRKDFAQMQVGFVAVGSQENVLRDPSDAMVREIKSPSLNLKKYSQCVADSQSVRDRATGVRGVLLKVCRICWTGPNSALLEYGYITGGIHGRLTTAEAYRTGGIWQFTPRKMALY